MRRRQIFAMQSNVTNEVRHDEEVKEASEAAEEVLKVKACPKCGKMIARGMFMHAKHCKG